MPQSISLAVLAVRLIEWGISSTVCVWSRVWYIVDSGCMVKSLVYSRQWVYGQEFGIVDSGCMVKSLVYSRQCVYCQEFGI